MTPRQPEVGLPTLIAAASLSQASFLGSVPSLLSESCANATVAE